jgi:hypothetical protein
MLGVRMWGGAQYVIINVDVGLLRVVFDIYYDLLCAHIHHFPYSKHVPLNVCKGERLAGRK